jgi:hypothetical protein
MGVTHVVGAKGIVKGVLGTLGGICDTDLKGLASARTLCPFPEYMPLIS